jgi:diketogulonate reductase-like aldo/keto reductase
VGRAIEGRRDEVFLVSKVLPSNASRRGTIAACERSLSRLKTDRLDCYLLHWRGAHPLAETVAAFEELRSGGKIRAWGVSNFDVDDLEELASLAGADLPACNQVLYHLEERAIEHAVLPWCVERGVAIVAYTPFGESPQTFDPQTRRGRMLQEIGASHSATARQVALAFLLRHQNAFVIPKASRRDHASENAGAGALRLSGADYARIEAAFPRGKPRPLPVL